LKLSRKKVPIGRPGVAARVSHREPGVVEPTGPRPLALVTVILVLAVVLAVAAAAALGLIPAAVVVAVAAAEFAVVGALARRRVLPPIGQEQSTGRQHQTAGRGDPLPARYRRAGNRLLEGISGDCVVVQGSCAPSFAGVVTD
jgi:hypothetical protein